MRYLFASLAVMSAAPAQAQIFVGPTTPTPPVPYTLDTAVDAMVIDNARPLVVQGQCRDSDDYPIVGEFVPNAAGRRALRDQNLSDYEIQALLGRGCSSTPAFTLRLWDGLGIIGIVPRNLNELVDMIGSYSPELQSDPDAQRENVRRHELGHVYFDSAGYNKIYNASSIGQRYATMFPVERPDALSPLVRTDAAPVDELIGDATMVCKAAADGEADMQTQVFLNWRERDADVSSVYKNAGTLTPEFVSTLQSACRPLGPEAPGQDIMRTTVRTLLQGPWDFLLK